jgi:hypothetical protein
MSLNHLLEKKELVIKTITVESDNVVCGNVEVTNDLKSDNLQIKNTFSDQYVNATPHNYFLTAPGAIEFYWDEVALAGFTDKNVFMSVSKQALQYVISGVVKFRLSGPLSGTSEKFKIEITVDLATGDSSSGVAYGSSDIRGVPSIAGNRVVWFPDPATPSTVTSTGPNQIRITEILANNSSLTTQIEFGTYSFHYVIPITTP